MMKTYCQKPINIHSARLTTDAVAAILGFLNEDDIPVLVGAGLLKVLGKPTDNAKKYFARIYIMELAEDVNWLNKATQCLYDYWKDKNNRKNSPQIATPRHSNEISLCE